MPIVEHSVTVRGPIEDVFDLSQSYALRLDWDPFVRSQRPLGGAHEAAKGVLTETVSRHRLRMVTEYLTFRRPTLVGMKMVEGPPLFENFSGSWRFAPRDDGRVDVAFRYNFTCSPSWLAPVMERIGVWYLGRDIEHRIEAFRAACDDTDLMARVRAERAERDERSDGPAPERDEATPVATPAPLPPIVDAAVVRAANVVVCDVRSTMTGADPRADFLERHLPGAIYVPLEGVLAGPAARADGRHPLPSPIEFATALGALGIAADVPVVAYDDRGGAFAARLVWMLRIIGQPAALLDGGLGAWDGPIVDGLDDAIDRVPVERSPVDWPIDAIADADRVIAHLVAAGVVIDSRDAARYAGEVEPIDKVAGHVPGAINLPFTHNLGPDGRFRPAGELTERFTAANAGRDSIVYCGSGVTACHNALAIEHAGLGLPSVYIGSWSGWTSDHHRPIATDQR